MSVYDDVLTSVITTMQAAGTNDNIYIGALPPDNALGVAWANASYNAFFNKSTASIELSLVFNGKNTNQQSLSDHMGTIHLYLSTLTSYPVTDSFQITNIQTISPPSLLSREENNQILYGSSLAVKFYLKEV